jgi:2-aminoethylphosphonate transport system substrate-binding protein
MAKKADWAARWKNDVIGNSGKQVEVVKPAQ